MKTSLGLPIARQIALSVGVLIGLAGAPQPGTAQTAPEARSWVVAKVVKIDAAESRITLSAIMGHKDLKAKEPAMLEKVKVGDRVRFLVGSNGNEVVITDIEVVQ